ncbi:uncharacterized protein AMSG_05412 [Thecamonas trahens ATCC 50062]|uniref:Purple acid phosphatase n=1 Tax=Thecamonas trahens ATCC 50062 TaxID=461836 RepID=A0A0L0DAM6_THETB|nr:hypothetical protein AMSG_05412 [Thecamonas trahens ATCC 50062]KNC49409.1 hypothetical protein AMSG_05412 [Thecamonas trahens ATCC 50062]|eukprot:XP_013757833.1 hypothetical protein AMSG_05412 [Thecamonas trahens ATCC 50062]
MAVALSVLAPLLAAAPVVVPADDALRLALGGIDSSIGAQQASNTSSECDVCLALVDTFAARLLDNATRDDATRELDALCGKLLGELHRLCDDLAAALDGAIWGWANEASFATVICAEVKVCEYACCQPGGLPEQVHLSLQPLHNGSGAMGIRATWATLPPIDAAVIAWGLSPADLGSTVSATRYTHSSGGWKGWLYTGVMAHLPPGARVYYKVGAPGRFSPVFHFRVPGARSATARGMALLFIGDMGILHSAPTMAALADEVATGEWDALLFNGDISYMDGSLPLLDEYLRRMERVLAYLPAVYSPGNHDCPYKFEPYLKVFPFDGPGEPPLYYSLDLGFLHITVLATDYPNNDPIWPDGTFGFAPGTPQHAWIEADLASPAAAAAAWRFTLGHRPFLCSSTSNGDWADCFGHAPLYREWLEPAMHAAGVDLALQSHQHAYERSYPSLDGKLVSTSYASPNATVYIVNGAAGNIEGHAPTFVSPPLPFSAARNGTVYGYARMWLSAPDASPASLRFEFVAADSRAVIDSFVLTKLPSE